MIARWQCDLVNTKESILSVYDKPYHTNTSKLLERGGDWGFAELRSGTVVLGSRFSIKVYRRVRTICYIQQPPSARSGRLSRSAGTGTGWAVYTDSRTAPYRADTRTPRSGRRSRRRPLVHTSSRTSEGIWTCSGCSSSPRDISLLQIHTGGLLNVWVTVFKRHIKMTSTIIYNVLVFHFWWS